MIKKFILTFLALLATTSFAQQQPGVHPSYVSIKMRSDAIDIAPQAMTMCGGVVVDEKRKLIATAWHCVPNSRLALEKKGMFSVGGMNAQLVDHSDEADIAIFRVDNLKGLKAPRY